MLLLAVFVSFCFLASTARTQTADSSPAAARPPQKTNARPASPVPTADPFDKATPAEINAQCVTLDTEAGAIELEMLADTAPTTARNFLNLTAAKAFDTTTFSRIVKNFIIQGGDLSTRATLTPALAERARRTIPDEPNAVKHTRGIVSMARTAEANSATTNFFILVGNAPHLDATFAAFGRVRAGMDVVDKINSEPATNEKPEKPVRVRQATIAPCKPVPPAAAVVGEH